MGAQMMEVPLLGAGTALRFESDAWLMVKGPRQATNEYPSLRTFKLSFLFCSTCLHVSVSLSLVLHKVRILFLHAFECLVDI